MTMHILSGLEILETVKLTETATWACVGRSHYKRIRGSFYANFFRPSFILSENFIINSNTIAAGVVRIFVMIL